MGCKGRGIGKESKRKKKQNKTKQNKRNSRYQYVLFQVSRTARISPFSDCRSYRPSLVKQIAIRAKYFPLGFTRAD